MVALALTAMAVVHAMPGPNPGPDPQPFPYPEALSNPSTYIGGHYGDHGRYRGQSTYYGGGDNYYRPYPRGYSRVYIRKYH